MKFVMVRDVPDALHKKFKIACVKKNISMNKCMIELIKQYVAKNSGK